ncbi:tetratricopeptide repeat protein [Seonamhaeicola sp. MEBiC1930]|uniref:tetratricopeptide repeat protein n=1 Tax=Seonamhaeicola sp. MEBiC01930 TaxID=2976768 RepID=UPI00324560D3
MKNFILILLIIPLSSFTQNTKETDSLLKTYSSLTDNADKVKTLDKIYYSVLYNNPKLAKQYAFNMLELATELKETREIGYANFNIGTSFRQLGQKDSATFYWEKAKTIFEKNNIVHGVTLVNSAYASLALESGNHDLALQLTKKNINLGENDSTSIGLSYSFMGIIYRQKGDFKLALEYCFKALNLLDDPDRQLEKADVLSEIARIEGDLANYDNAIKFLNEASAIYRIENDKNFLAQSLSNIGGYYNELEAFSKAEKVLTQALELAREVTNPVIEGFALKQLGTTYMGLNQTEKSRFYLERALNIGEKHNRVLDVIQVSYRISQNYNYNSNTAMALKYANKAIHLSDSVNTPLNLLNSLELRSLIYKKQNQFQLALEDHARFKFLQDSLYVIEKSKQIEELKTIYETEKKELQIAQQETEISLLEQEAQINNLQRILLGGGLVLSILLFGLGYYALQQKIKRNRLEKERVKSELDFKKKELTTHALHLAKKNEVLENLKQQAKAFKATSKEDKGYQELIKTINFDQHDDKNWENFTQYFEQVHKDFSSNVKSRYPEVTKNELRLMALLKMNMSSKEIATILNISADGVKKARQRLRKKMNLTPQDSLEYIVLAL